MAGSQLPTVLILGAGINGAALARELALQCVNVCLVDRADLACGATAYSSRLIHGGLRYLEFGEFDLVRESLAERGRLLRLAPQLVKPLRLFIPVERRSGGLLPSAARFLGLERWFSGVPRRGRWMVQVGLWLYDRFARDASLPRHSVVAARSAHVPPVDASRYRWLCSYFDAQVQWPERLVVALLDDAQQAARQAGGNFELFTYTTVRLEHGTAIVTAPNGRELRRFAPDVVVNATGAWVDETLARLHVESPKLMGGTKGSHLVCHSPRLREALRDGGLYAEADDGRPVFVLPFGELSLVGTTDIAYHGDPAEAVASDDEVNYLLATVNRLLPAVQLGSDEVLLHYCGVRPLPATLTGSTAAITRRHWMQEHRQAPLPMYSIIGGKLTTCRSLAEESTDTILQRLGRQRVASTRDRPLVDNRGGVVGALPLNHDLVRQLIRAEWVERLDDLVERRLMLLYQPRLSRSVLRELAGLLVDEGRLAAADADAAVASVVARLAQHFGRRLVD